METLPLLYSGIKAEICNEVNFKIYKLIGCKV